MLWEDLVLDRSIPDRPLQQALGATFGVAPEAVRVVEPMDYANAGEDASLAVLVVRTPLAGEFPLQAGVYLRDEEVETRLGAPAERLARVKHLCELLHCTALMSDESLDPYSWLRVGASGAVESVTLDADRLDREEFAVVSARPADLSPAQTS